MPDLLDLCLGGVVQSAGEVLQCLIDCDLDDGLSPASRGAAATGAHHQATKQRSPIQMEPRRQRCQPPQWMIFMGAQASGAAR